MDDQTGSTSGAATDGPPPATSATISTSERDSLGPTASGTETETSGSGSLTADGSTATGVSETTVEVEIYDEQPMVVDVTVTTPGSTVELQHPSDMGVVVSLLETQGNAHRFRVRGLRPDTDHTMVYTVDGEADEVAFTTAAALPGYIGAFAIDATPISPDPVFRMFDLMPIAGDTTGLVVVDPVGFTRWYWGIESDTPLYIRPVTGAKLLDDGTVAFLTGYTAFVISELGEILLEISDGDLGVLGLHHEITPLPNGNFLALSHTFRDIDYVDYGTLYVAGDQIVEFTSDGEVVWTWDTFDHLDPQRIRHGFFELGRIINPETFELGYDWTHSNGIIYDEDEDTIVLSIRHQDWLVKIDHATGDVLWRLGDEGDFSLDGDRWHFHQHSPQWLDDGSLVLYDNGVGNPDLPDVMERSRAVQYELDESTWTATQVWTDQADPFVSIVASDVDPLPGGHMLILDTGIGPADPTQGRLREVEHTAEAANVWTLWPPPVSFVYRATAHDRLPGQTP